MLKTRTRRRAAQSARAGESLAEIEASIMALGNEDLLDLADIVSGEPRTPLAQSAFAEMAKRGISL